jgi:hypothetical protein
MDRNGGTSLSVLGLAGACCAIALAAGGCGEGSKAQDGPTADLRLTREFGRELVAADGDAPLEGPRTKRRLIVDNHDVGIDHMGGMARIGGLRVNRDGGKDETLWASNVNGIEGDLPAEEYELYDGDVFQVDLRDYYVTLDVRATVGAFPETFTRGVFGRRFPVTVRCERPASPPCLRVKRVLRRAGVAIDGSKPPGGLPPRGNPQRATVLVGRWKRWRDGAWARRIDRGPRYSGVFARFAPNGGSMSLLDWEAHRARGERAGTGLVAAQRPTEEDLVWYVTGVDDEGVERAAEALGSQGMRDAFAVAITADGTEKLPLPPEPIHPVTDAVNELQEAFLASDEKRVCARMTAAARNQMGQIGHEDPTRCPRDLHRVLGMIEKGGGWRHKGQPRVADVETHKDQGVATITRDDGWRAGLPFSKRSGAWKLDGFFGVSPEDATRVAASIRKASFPAAASAGVEVSDKDGACPRLSDTRFPRVSGGCQLKMSSGRDLRMTALTPFGDFKFDDCSIDYRVRVDRSGRTWTTGVDVYGHGAACGDVNECVDQHELVPWRGRIRRDGNGGFVHVMRVCLRTCVGFFAGTLRMRLSHDDDGWRAELADADGNTGFRFAGPLAVRSDGLEIAAADDR